MFPLQNKETIFTFDEKGGSASARSAPRRATQGRRRRRITCWPFGAVDGSSRMISRCGSTIEDTRTCARQTAAREGSSSCRSFRRPSTSGPRNRCTRMGCSSSSHVQRIRTIRWRRSPPRIRDVNKREVGGGGESGERRREDFLERRRDAFVARDVKSSARGAPESRDFSSTANTPKHFGFLRAHL